MSHRFVRFVLMSSLAACGAALFMAPLAETGSSPPKGGFAKGEEGVTVGALARRVVAEAAANAPAGGFDERFSLGLIGVLGYEHQREPGEPATLRDLQEMLGALGVEATTATPDQPLTAEHLVGVLDSVRGAVPRFDLPESLLDGKRIGANPETHNFKTCFARFLACKRDCTVVSPSVPLLHCFEQCFLAFRRCYSQ